jgi:hypothetical protein
MTSTALKEAAQVGFPRDKMVGPWPTCAEPEMVRPLVEATAAQYAKEKGITPRACP